MSAFHQSGTISSHLWNVPPDYEQYKTFPVVVVFDADLFVWLQVTTKRDFLFALRFCHSRISRINPINRRRSTRSAP